MLKRNALVKLIRLTKFYICNRDIIGVMSRLMLITLSASLVLSACSLGSATNSTVNGSNANAVVVDSAVAYIKRPLLFDNNGRLMGDDLGQPQIFRPGAVLYLKSSASPSASSIDISSSAFSAPSFLNDKGQLLYDVKDLSVSFDGKKLLFSMRAPDIKNAAPADQPKWNIWEYDQTSNQLRRIITGRTTAEAGQDLSPSYLPDGRILFTSTRQTRSKAILLDEGKAQFSAQDENRQTDTFNLHVMNSDGSAIQQLTFNQSHDLNPTVLENGKILFSRWDNAGQTSKNGMNLYEINPDGTQLTYIYGRHSHDSGNMGASVEYFKPRELENGTVAVQLRTLKSANFSSQPTAVNITDFVESDVPVVATTPGLGQQAIVNGLSSDGSPSLRGNFGAFFPLYDGTNRFLVSWSVCRIQLTDINPSSPGNQAGSVESCSADKLASGLYSNAEPAYGLWVLDADSNTQLPIEQAEQGKLFDEVVLMNSRALPAFIPAKTLSAQAQTLADKNLGIINIKSVYDFDGQDTSPNGLAILADPVQTTPSNRPQRFVRIEKPVSIPSRDVRDFKNSAFGRSRAQSMREILGYAPIEPDGSVKVTVPANVAFAISILDEKGQRTSSRHQNWMQVAPGETLQCIGCHTGNSKVPHGRFDAEPKAVNMGASTTGLPFPNTDPTLFADMGETMAETYARINSVRQLTSDIVFDDQWSDVNVVPKTASFTYAYADLKTLAPIDSTCVTVWKSTCRVTINYETHIHPLWRVDRKVLDANGVTVLEDHTCTSCHTNVDNMMAPRVPDGQLDLTDGLSTDNPDHFKSYHELLFNDNQVELSQGALIDSLVDSGNVNLIPQFNADGSPLLDSNGVPVVLSVPIFVNVNVPASMSTAGARNSTAFMSRFQAGKSHANYLSSAEMKLISEWLDLGAQYFNNPFDAPVN